MIKKCICCGSEFVAVNSKHKYCSRKCANHYKRGYRRTKEEYAREIKNRETEVIDLLKDGKTNAEIRSITGFSFTYIYKIRKRAGFEKQLTDLQKKVLEYRQQGLLYCEIANILGKEDKSIRKIAIRVGFPETEEEKSIAKDIGCKKTTIFLYGTVEERKEKIKLFIEQYHPGFDYVSGWLSGNEIMKLQCKGCGTIVEKSAIGVRRKNRMLKCPVCAEKEKERKQEEIKIQKEKEKKEKEKKEKETLFWLQPFKQEAVSFCPVCNSVFVGNGRKKYCSTICSKKMLNARGKDKRIRKIKNYTVDTDIEIHALFNRDNGKCWICGEQCDFEDYEIIDGAFVVGKTYPSIDHVFPLSKGGLHSWDNVKLAHHYCNTIKSDKVVGL